MRKSRPIALILCAVLALAGLAACAPKPVAPVVKEETTETPKAVEPATIRLGNLPTEDILPIWVAQQKGLFDQAGLKVEIVPFQSAAERDAAFTANAIDGFMGDMIAAVDLYEAGFKTRIVTVCLGATSAEGRFGIVAAPSSSIRSRKKLAGVPIGTSSGTIQEYVIDGLMDQAGVDKAEVKKEEIKKVPLRYELLMNNGIKAAALPEPFLSLALKEGAHLVSDDTQGKNVSQTVLVFSQDFLSKPEGAEAVKRLLDAWDGGAKLVNEEPDAHRELLVEKARLPKPVVESYEINEYPMHQLPAEPEVTAILEWMREKKLLNAELAYGDLVWEPGQTVAPAPPVDITSDPSTATTTP